MGGGQGGEEEREKSLLGSIATTITGFLQAEARNWEL